MPELEWIDEVKNDQPALMMAEGVTMYLTQKIMKQLLNRVVDRSPSGQIIFNAFSKLLIQLMSRATPGGTGATFNLGNQHSTASHSVGPRLDFVSSLKTSDFPGFSRLSLSDRMIAWLLMDLIPIFRRTQLPLLYRFPRPKESAKTESSTLGTSN